MRQASLLMDVIWGMFGFPPVEIASSKFHRFVKAGGYFIVGPVLFLITAYMLAITYGGKVSGIFFFVYILTLLLGDLLLRYDFSAVGYYRDDNNEYYRATGISKSDLKDIGSDKGKAARGEFNSYILGKKCKIPHKMLYNVCIPMPNGNYQEIDAMMITDRGIFVIECKNRAGVFSGYGYEWEQWYQAIGNTQNESENFYLQNQWHIYALDSFLQTNGVIPFAETFYNILLTSGELTLNIQGKRPNNFAYGNVDGICHEIKKMYSRASVIYVDNFVENAYRLLLPYALLNVKERDRLQKERETKSTDGKFTKGEWKEWYLENGIPGFINSPVVLRQNRIYTQMTVDGEDWYTFTNLKYRNVRN